MLTLEKTEYDLNTLFSFDVLKEILLKLARSQVKLEDEINEIKKTIKNNKDDFGFDNDIDNFNEQKYEEHENIENNNLNEDNKDNKIESNINIELKEVKEQNNEMSNIEENKENKEKKEEIREKDDKTEQIKKDENKYENITEKNDILQEKEIKQKEPEIKETLQKSNETQNKINQINDSNNKTPYRQKETKVKETQIKVSSPSSPSKQKNVSPDVITKIMRQLKSHQQKISELSENLNTESIVIKKYDIQQSNHDSQLSLINDKLNSIFEKLNSVFEKDKDYEQKFEDLQVKVANFDIFSLIQDSGDGTIDATKLMVKSLEDKVFKKFELIDQRYKADSSDNIKIKNNIDNLVPQVNLINSQIDKIQETQNQLLTDITNNKKETESSIDDIKNVLNNELKEKIDNLKNNFEKNFENKLLDIESKLNSLSQNQKDNLDLDLVKLNLRNNEINQDTIDNLDKKITELRKKMHDINNTLKIYMSNNNLDSIKSELNEFKLLLDKKIAKDDLKELYNYHMNTSDEINDLKDQISLTFEDIRKITKDINGIQQKIESINGNLALIQDNPKTGVAPIIDFSKYIDHQKLSESLRPVLKELEKIYKEIDSLRRDLSVVDEESKKYSKNLVNKLDEDLNKKINEVKNLIQKKYMDKIEINKIIKTLEVQIKSLGEDTKKDSDSWLLAKRPLKCFNCASCEANIKNEYASADYLPWKKYPKGDKIHRMGQGFSHMLQMMTSEFVKSIQDMEINTRNNFNSISTQFNERPNNVNNNINNNIMINNTREEFNTKNGKKNNKMKLPKVHPYSNTKLKKYKLENSLPVSDDENNYIDSVNNNEDEAKEDKNSPKILKIYKKNNKMGKDYENFELMSTRNNDFNRKFPFMKTDKNIYDKED